MNTEQKLSYIDKLIEKVVVQSSDETWGKNLNLWDWNPGVCQMGIINACKVTKNPKHIEMLATWFDHNYKRRAFGSVNNVAPANVPLYLMEMGNNPLYKEVVDEYVDWCQNIALRTVNGGFGHVWYFSDGSEGHPDYKNQLWVDTIYMAVIFMIRYGVKYKDEAVIKEGLAQAKLHLECLYDKDADFVFHAYQCNDKVNMGHHWGRGNGWFVATMADLIFELKDTAYDMSQFITAFVAIMNNGKKFAEPNGMLRTLIDVAESYQETTATALFSYAALKGHKLGLLDDSFKAWADTAVDTIASGIGPDLYIPNCSGGTNPGTKEEYMNIEISETMYANGLLIQLLAESI